MRLTYPFLDIALRIQSNLLQLIQAGADRLTISVEWSKPIQRISTISWV